jgi:AbiV family abortive infection protein
MSGLDLDWYLAVEKAASVGRTPYRTPQEFDRACEHVVGFLKDATLLLETGSHATAAFLAITAIEETAKVHILVFRRSAKEAPRRKDPLFRHDEKHHLALGPTVAMGARLQEAIGKEQMTALIDAARSGDLVTLRQSALYASTDETGRLVLPEDAVTFRQARNVLLLAIEAFDDGIAGYTNHSLDLSVETDQYFFRVAALT